MSEYKKEKSFNYKSIQHSGSYSVDEEGRSKKKQKSHYFLDARNKAPISNEKRFVFLWEEDFETFNFDKYNPDKSNGILTKQDLELLESELKKSGFYKIGEVSAISLYVVPWVLFLAVTIFMVLQYIDKKITNQILIGAAIGSSFVLAVLLTFYAKSRYNNRLKTRELVFKKIIKSVNRTIF